MSTIDTIHGGAGRISHGASPVTHGAMGLWTAFVTRMVEAADRRRSRRALATLSDEQLRDIGLTRSEARREAARPFWY